MLYSAATPHRFIRRNTAAPFLENYSAEMVHRLGLGRNRKSSGKRVFWIRVQMKRFPMATLDLALVIPGRRCCKLFAREQVSCCSKPTNTCGCPAVNNVHVGGTRLRVEIA